MRIHGVSREFEDKSLKIEIDFKKNQNINPEIIKNKATLFLERNKFRDVKLEIKFKEGIVILLFTYPYQGNVYSTVLGHEITEVISE